MGKALLAILVLTAVAAVWLAWARSRQQSPADQPAIEIDSTDRVAAARRARSTLVEEKYRAVAVAYPGEIFLRWFKHEAELELWARNADRRFRLVATYPILASSGLPGPKRREGDRQVPEGFYEIDRFNPQSSYHLSLGLNYPNAADRVHADPLQPGSDIFIHGANVSIGCAPIGNEAIEEVYLAALDAHTAGQTHIAVHIFPARMAGADWARFTAQETANRPELADFWLQLLPVYEAFERLRLVPEVEMTAEGRYVLKTR
jgi:murein L,D-transpeptidase YafK